MQGFSLRDSLDTIMDAKWSIMGVVVLVVLGALASMWVAGPTYTADALLRVEATVRGIGPFATTSTSVLFGDEAVMTEEVEIIRSRSVLRPVVEQFQLDITAKPLYFPIVGSAMARSNAPTASVEAAWFDLSQYTWGAELIERLKKYNWATKFMLGLGRYGWGGERIKIERFDVPAAYQGKDKIFDLVAGADSRYELFDNSGQKLLDGTVGAAGQARMGNGELVMLLVSELVARPGTYFQLAREPSLSAIDNLSDRLRVTEEGGATKSGLIQVTLEGSNPGKVAAIVNSIVDAYLRQNVESKSAEAQKTLEVMEAQLPALKEHTENAENALNAYRLQQGTANLTVETEGVLQQIVARETTLSQLRRDRQQLLQKFTTQHPQIATLDAQIGTLNRELGALNGKVKSLPDTQQEILRLSRDVEVYTGLYTMLLNKVQELKVAKEGLLGNASVVDRAAAAGKPIKPKPAQELTIAVILGILLGVGLAFFRKALHSGIEDPDIIEQRLGLPIYATVPRSVEQKKVMRRALRKEQTQAVLASVNPEDLAIESLRSLRTLLHFAVAGANNNVIMITGSVPAVGKSFVSANLGVVLATAGKRVLLIDGDLRKGCINDFFGIDRKQGLSDFIAGDIETEQLVRKTNTDGLNVIPTGTLPPNPSELLLHERFASVLETLSSQYDYVIVDSSPILAVTDPAIIGSLAGVTLLVVKAGEHPLREIEEAAKRLRQAGANLCGVVFNNIDISRSREGYGKYGYTYAYKR
ncbi:MAG: polysaccharide biosynthesis tyrosine autokinase [Chromatiales bacterium]